MALTPQQRTDLQSIETSMRAAEVDARAWLKKETGGFFGTSLLSDAELAAVKAVEDELVRTEDWMTGHMRRWVEAGWHPDGYEYRFEPYLRSGHDMVAALAFYTGQYDAANRFKAYVDAQVQNAKDLLDGVQRVGGAVQTVAKGVEQLVNNAAGAASGVGKPWSTWSKLAVGAGTLGVAALAVRRLVK